jgi:hypothetical protein
VTRDTQASPERTRTDLEETEFSGDRFEAVEVERDAFQWLLLAGLLLGAMVAWIIAGRRVEAPWIMGDELTYSEYAKSFAESGEFLFREEPTAFLSIYPALIAPAWLADSVVSAYSLAKVINVVLMTSAAVPLFLWAKRLVTPGLAFLAVFLLLVMPSFVYTGSLMTESAFLPAFLLAAFATALMLERPTLIRQLLVLGAVAICILIRLQGFILVLVVPTAVVFKALIDLRAEKRTLDRDLLKSELRPYFGTAVVVTVAVIAYVVLTAARGRELGSVLGAYKEVPNANYSVREVGRWTVTHLGELSLAVGLLPVSALVVLLVLAWQRAARFTHAERAFLAFTAAAVPLMVVHVAAFASEHSLRVEERNMFYLAPLFFLALAVWLGRGLPRPPRTTPFAVLLPAALLLAVPFEGLFNVSITTDTFALIPFLRLADLLEGSVHDVRIIIVGGALGAGLLFSVPPRWLARVAIPAAVALFLVLSSYSVSGSAKTQSHAKRFAYLLGPNANWIDDRLGPDGDAAFLVTPELTADQDVALQSEFWNRSVRDVYAFEGAVHAFPGVPVAAEPRTGVLATGTGARPRPPYAVVDTTSVTVAGTKVAENGRLGLFRLDRPLRLAADSAGIQPDGWTGADAVYTQYWTPEDKPANMTLEVSRVGVSEQVPPARVRVEVGRLATDGGATSPLRSVLARGAVTIAAGEARAVNLPVPRPPFAVRLHVERTFSPAEYGEPDTRELGARVSFRFRLRG